MFLWFISLAVSGIISIIHVPSVWKAINPFYAGKFPYQNGLAGFFVLSEVILCATGGEALYADMGHMGRKTNYQSMVFRLCALLLNYLGQGAFIIQTAGKSTNFLWYDISPVFSSLYTISCSQHYCNDHRFPKR